jgi:hypothetical protein
MKNDGNGAVRERLRQFSGNGKGFGREDDAFGGAVGIANAKLKAAGEDGMQLGTLWTTARAEGGGRFVEQKGGRIAGLGVDAIHKRSGGVATGEGGVGAEEAEQAQAKRFAGEFAGGLDCEVRSSSGGREAVSMENPEGEDNALLLAALEITGEEGGNLVKQFGRLLGLGGFGFWSRLSWLRSSAG